MLLLTFAASALLPARLAPPAVGFLLAAPEVTALRLPPPVMQVRQQYGAAARAATRGGFTSGRIVPTRAPYNYNGRVVNAPYAGAAVQGGSLRTFSNRNQQSPSEVVFSTDGRPLDASMELWTAPGYTPRKMRVYSDDGQARPFRSFETPRGPNTVAVRNRGPIEFPIAANVGQPGLGRRVGRQAFGPDPYGPVASSRPVTIQGGASRSFPFDHTVGSVQVQLFTEGRNLNARVELLQGPDNVKQFIELEEDDGYNRPFVCTFDTPGYGHVVRIINTGPMEFPITATLVPQRSTRPLYDDRRACVGGSGGSSRDYRGYDNRGYDGSFRAASRTPSRVQSLRQQNLRQQNLRQPSLHRQSVPHGGGGYARPRASTLAQDRLTARLGLAGPIVDDYRGGEQRISRRQVGPHPHPQEEDGRRLGVHRRPAHAVW